MTKSSTEDKIKIILEELRAIPDITENHRRIIERCLDACECNRYTHARFLGFNRTAIIDSHTKHLQPYCLLRKPPEDRKTCN